MFQFNGQSWKLQAKCLEHPDPEIFFHGTKEAKKVCAECPVATQCLQYALDNKIEWGVWGGLNGRERRQLGRYLRKQTEVLEKQKKEQQQDDIEHPIAS